MAVVAHADEKNHVATGNVNFPGIFNFLNENQENAKFDVMKLD